ncbi:P-loop containing nucleoside triphosphate hydrolase protein [Trichoderma chlorosporum]
MKRKAQSHPRNLRNSRFRDNTVINQGDAHFHISNQPARALIHVIPYPRNENFVNRSEIVNRLEELLPQSSDNYNAALCGLGGSGKTQIALNYAYHQCDTRSVFWVHADTKATIINDYKMIANKFGIGPDVDDEGLLMAVRRHIEAEPQWLLVLDNADDLSVFGVGQVPASSKSLFEIIPQGPRGLVLWTSRDKRIMTTLVGSLQAIEVGELSLEEAKKLLAVATATTQSQTTNHDPKDIDTLLEDLQYHALAISQAGAYMRRTSTSVRDYTAKLAEKRKRQKLLEKSEFDRHRKFGAPNSILETWSISMDRIQQENKRAFIMFNTITYFDSQNVPLPLIERAGIRRGLRKEEEDDDDDDGLEEAITRLKELFLIHDGESAMLRMRKHLEKEPNFQKNTSILTHQSEEEDELFFVRHALDSKEIMQPYTYVILTHAAQVPEWMELCGEDNYLGDHDNWIEKELLDQRVLAIRWQMLGEKHPDTIKSMAALAMTYMGLASSFKGRDPATLRFGIGFKNEACQNIRKRAEEIVNQVIELRQRIFGPTNPETIASRKMMTDVYCLQLRLNEAEESARQLLTIQQHIYGDKHPYTLTAVEDLAYVYDISGQCDKALDIREKVLHFQKETVGETALATSLAMYNLALSWHRCGRQRDALTLMRQCENLHQDHHKFHRTIAVRRNVNTQALSVPAFAVANFASNWEDKPLDRASLHLRGVVPHGKHSWHARLSKRLRCFSISCMGGLQT